VRDKGQFLEGVGVGEMPKVVEKPGAQEGADPFGAEPGIGAPLRQVKEEPPGQMIHPQGMSRPGMSRARINHIRRAKLKNPVKPCERKGADQCGHTGAKVDMTPKDISDRLRVTVTEGRPSIIAHARILHFPVWILQAAWNLRFLRTPGPWNLRSHGLTI
jgi:hypothetical protein